MSEKIEPCAWCGEEATEMKRDLHPGPRCSTIKRTYRCMTSDCLGSWIGDKTVEVWNARQAAIMEARRKDFDAGVSATLGTKMSWQDRDSWFDDYIKETK